VAYDRGHQQDLAEACKTTAVVVTRATQTLIAHGWCRKSEETGRFYPTPQFTRLTFGCWMTASAMSSAWPMHAIP
jgi:DNA-binding IclR family transcriptional regulator